MSQKPIPLRIGLTGGIGSGKSYVSAGLRTAGIPVYDSDSEAKRLMNEDPALRMAIRELLGDSAYRDGLLDKVYVARRVFSERDLLENLNAIVHPAVRRDFLDWAGKQTSSVVVQESALIFEKDMRSQYNRVVLVTAPLSLRLGRVARRDGSSESEVMSRIRNQLPDRVKLPGADFWIKNVTREETDAQIRRLAVYLKNLRTVV